MRFSAREDIAASPEAVFAALTDFEKLERQALRRGVEVQRTDKLDAPGAGASWSIGFKYRGQRRLAETRISKMTSPETLEVLASVSGLSSTGVVDLTRLGAQKTRLHVVFDVRPETFRARMVMHAVRLGKSRLNERFKMRVARIAREIEGR